MARYRVEGITMGSSFSILVDAASENQARQIVKTNDLGCRIVEIKVVGRARGAAGIVRERNDEEDDLF